MKNVIFLLMVFLPITAQARPVSYAGGWMLMGEHDMNSSAVDLTYSPTARYAIGFRHEYFREDDVQMDTGQLSWLVKRWNNPGSQANIYLQSGAGVAYGSGEFEPAAFAGISADWENRRYFTMYSNRALWAGDAMDDEFKHKARVGIAPYIGDAGDIHTWVMIQADYEPGERDDFSVTPLVRVFKGSTLMEAGYNLDGGILLNFTHTF